MRRFIQHIGLLFVIGIIVMGCTTKANTYYNRQMQPIVTKYNVLYNGEEAFDLGLKELHEQFQDDFTQILPVEPINTSGKIQLDGIENPNFERAEEKAIKTIQLHSMVFKGEQRNYKIDDAYILLGKSRYHNERFLPALEAFNHLLTNYGKSERIPEAAVWAEKTNLRLGKPKIAIERLRNLLITEKLKRNDRAEAYATLGQAYINEEMYPQAADALYAGGKYTRNKNLKGRYYFIAAQLYEKQKKRDSAVAAYEKVIKLNWKIPRRLWVEAQAGKARNKDFSPEEKQDFLTYLTKLEKRYEHRKMLDVLYFTHGQLIEADSKVMAADFYRKSLKNNTENSPLKAKTHERLADVYFEQKDYTGAYHHLDSTLAYVPEHTFERLYIERKKENLAKITELEYVVKQNDSIQKIVSLSDKERYDFFQKHIDSLQKVAEQKAQRTSKNDFGSGILMPNTSETHSGKFYFHNSMAVAYGKQQFQQFWGNRALEDNWRWAAKENNTIAVNQNVEPNEEARPKEEATPEHYIAQLPKTQAEIQAFEKERNQALYQLGVLYKAKFNDTDLAISRLERVLAQNPEEGLKMATLYELYKNYKDLNNPKFEEMKNKLLADYPESDYASILKGSPSSKEQKNQQAQAFLDSLTTDFENGTFSPTLERLTENDYLYRETAVAPKLDLLKAALIGRLQGVEAYQAALEGVAVAYPDTDESLQAKEIIEKLKGTDPNFFEDAKTKSWKVAVTNLIDEERPEIATQLTEKLQTISDKITLSEDVYNHKEVWIVIHGLQNRDTALHILSQLHPIVEKYKLTAFPIATENYRLVQIKKAKEAYLQQKE
ncbi:tetratricopeptide repeat protein [Capnocytophaga sp.]|uniref:type IX secretion system periplasmic lipoprotein PorW/SprE n=1 Tax=Capnocytophaga sp. TaxID=44737 RepID=UPI0026DC34B3|nr:tetratricopeptide repeat protein [Capnocytophaga sp.]MDO5105208.1 tetratricopeptide repeat protein [Capnocytophaga sp.]